MFLAIRLPRPWPRVQGRTALDAIRGEAKVAGQANRRGAHRTPINAWKRQAIEGMAGVFSGRPRLPRPRGRANW